MLSEEALRAFEERLGIILPEQYRHFLLVHNGGEASPDVFKIRNEQGPYTDSVVRCFFSIGDVPNYRSFEWHYNLYKIEEDRLPHNMIPIADDPGGNLICISTVGTDAGAVYFWNHEEETEPPSDANLHLIADTFQEFLGALYKPPKYVESAYDCIHRTGDIAELVELIRSGWDVNEVHQGRGLTAIETAAGYGKAEFVRILLQHGAEVRGARDIAVRGLSIAVIAELYDYQAVIQVIDAHANASG